MERKVYKIFGKVLLSDKPKVSFVKMNELAMQRGLFVPANLCFEWLYDLLEDTQINPNSTFYQSWQDITSKTRFELFLDQVRHYASTYGTDFQEKTWTPEHSKLPEFPFKELKVLEGITVEQMKEEFTKLAYSNIAMSTETLTIICDIKYEYHIELDLEKVKNRELKLRLIPMDYEFKNGQECLLWILWKWFNISMLVKNKETLESINADFNLKNIFVNNQNILASVFYRNKDVFMRFKKCQELRPIINRIRRLAPQFHKPMPVSDWLQLEKIGKSKRAKLFESASIFKLVQMYNALSNPTGYYVIRNGKAFYKENAEREVNQAILNELLMYIVSKVPQVESVTLPEGIELAMPTSEKNFVGDIPLGSYVNCADENTMIGIYWRNEWGAKDLDLHAATIDGTFLGWRNSYRFGDNNIVFSGDMTNADPEASEIMWFKKSPVDSIVSVCKYRGDSHYSYDVFIAQESAKDFKENYMIDPRNIIFKGLMEFKDKTDVTLGFFKDGKFIFHSCNVGHGQVPNEWRIKILEHLTQCSYLTMRQVFELAGIKITKDSENELISKGDIINFFTES